MSVEYEVDTEDIRIASSGKPIRIHVTLTKVTETRSRSGVGMVTTTTEREIIQSWSLTPEDTDTTAKATDNEGDAR